MASSSDIIYHFKQKDYEIIFRTALNKGVVGDYRANSKEVETYPVQSPTDSILDGKLVLELVSQNYIPTIKEKKIVWTRLQDPLLNHFEIHSTPIRNNPPKKIKDEEGYYYQHLQKGFDSKNLAIQLSCLEKLGQIYLDRKDFTNALQLFNGALCLCKKTQATEISKLSNQLEKTKKLYLSHYLDPKVAENYQDETAKYRHYLESIRNHLKEDLKGGVSPGEIQCKLTEKFKDLIRLIVSKAVQFIGPPPTKFAVFGLGSMARYEMSPYSDVEFGFVIEEDSEPHRKYFRKLSHLVELSILSLQETEFLIIRERKVGDKWIEGHSFTPSGFSMDKGLSPRGMEGSYELIGSPDALARFQSPRSAVENIILTNSMATTTFVYGHKSIFEEYQKKAASTLKPLAKERAITLIRDHLREFRPYLEENRAALMSFDAKKDFYRPIQMMVSGLTLYYGVDEEPVINKQERTAGSTLLGIQKLEKKGIFTQKNSHYLQKVLQQATGWRLKTQLYYGEEKEILSYVKPKKRSEKSLYSITNEEATALLEAYRVLIPFQKAMTRFINNPDLSFPSLLLYDKKIGKYSKETEASYKYADAAVEAARFAALNPNNLYGPKILRQIKENQGELKEALVQAKQHEKLAIELIEKLDEGKISYDNLPDSFLLRSDMRYANNPVMQGAFIKKCVDEIWVGIGDLYLKMGKKGKAEKYYQRSLDLYKTGKFDLSLHTPKVYHRLGVIYYEQGRLKKAIEVLELCISTYKNKPTGTNLEADEIAQTLFYLGLAYKDVGNTLKAEDSFSMYIAIKESRYTFAVSAYGAYELGLAYCKIGIPEKAIAYLNETVEKMDKETIFSEPKKADVFSYLADAYKEIGSYEKAARFYKKLLTLQNLFYGDIPNIYRIKTLMNLGECFTYLDNKKEAKNYLHQILEIYKENFTEKPSNKIWALAFLAKLYATQKDKKKGEEYFNKVLDELEVFQFSSNKKLASDVLTDLAGFYRKRGDKNKEAECNEVFRQKTKQSIEKPNQSSSSSSIQIKKSIYADLVKGGFNSHCIVQDELVQKFLIEKMLETSQQKLNFYDAWYFADKDLLKVIEKKYKSLITLDLRGTEVTFKSLEMLAKKCTQLKELYLPSVKKIEQSGLIYSSSIFFPNLQALYFNSWFLNRIKLRAPKLKTLTFNSKGGFMGKIEALKLDTPNLEQLNSSLIDGRIWEWAHYFGELRQIPPLPVGMDKLLKSPCPFFKGKKIEETHRFIFMPETVNGKSYSLPYLDELVKRRRVNKGRHIFRDFNKFFEFSPQLDKRLIRVKNISKANTKGYWLLATKQIVPNTIQKTPDTMERIIKPYNYHLPTALEAATSFTMGFLTEQNVALKDPLKVNNGRVFTATITSREGSESSHFYAVGTSETQFTALSLNVIGRGLQRTATKDIGAIAVKRLAPGQ
ncbi:tetratricopeptide repeat protein [Candidatus Neptunochlamydia vexilliferae]|uniref:Protein-PII uridylyltransferase N-terminal domain-containing protein n=1 Tax=Candidatus Neptunichlamydia vexilliferae TaxID=1651774 RepID=A0ABS0B022_9BACT|nr:tetratricopeptide repeat protein [Candidatus Neptunochlamydia vexilliferae]MBF5059734.1 hypothetical protein [Candidatus Neptunochlamydia vexilliferae]